MRKIKVKGSIPSLNTLTKQSLCIPAIDLVLMRDKGTEDRGHGWNSPSGIGGCMRASYYTRIGVPKTNANDDPRAIRILNNGTFVHERLQSYLRKSGILLLDEAPVFNVEHQIMGHTDGLLLDGDRLAILEIKSINSGGFKLLNDAKEEHKLQASLYMYCIDEMRKQVLLGKELDLIYGYQQKLNEFIKGNEKVTKEQKIKRYMAIFEKTIALLKKYPKPIQKIIFLYECKDTQELKEFPYMRDKDVVDFVISKCDTVNNFVKEGILPEKEESPFCKWCNYRGVCNER